MRAIKTILIIVGALLGLLVILGLMGPKTYRYERSTTVKAPVKMVYENVSSLGAMDKWSPWNEYDPNMKKTIEGTDGQVGAVSKWEGNSDVGKGEQRIDSLVPNTAVRTHLTFLEPWQQECEAGIDLGPTGDSTKVTWYMSGENGFMGRVMGVFMDMDAMIGKDFEKGLATLKSQTEEECMKMEEEMKAMMSAYPVEHGDRPSTLYIGIKSGPGLKWSDIGKFFEENMPKVGEAVKKAKLQPVGPPSGLYFDWNEKDMTTDMMAAIPVRADGKGAIEGFAQQEVPASAAYWTVYKGGYNGMKPAHDAVMATLEHEGMGINDVVIEEYVTDPMTVKDSTQWVTNIIYLAKPGGTTM